jgi:hypothetical protein
MRYVIRGGVYEICSDDEEIQTEKEKVNGVGEWANGTFPGDRTPEEQKLNTNAVKLDNILSTPAPTYDASHPNVAHSLLDPKGHDAYANAPISMLFVFLPTVS